MTPTSETYAIAKGIGRIYAETRGRETSTIEFVERVQVFIDDTVGKLELERDEWKASHDNQVNLRRALMDRPDLKERAELVTKLAQELNEERAAYKSAISAMSAFQEERDQLRADIKTMETRHAAAMLHNQAVVDENIQLRKVADELALGMQRNDLRPLRSYSQLPHVKQKETHGT